MSGKIVWDNNNNNENKTDGNKIFITHPLFVKVGDVVLERYSFSNSHSLWVAFHAYSSQKGSWIAIAPKAV